MVSYKGTLTREQILAGWIEGTRLGLRLAAREVVTFGEELGQHMDFDHVIYSFGNGIVASVRGLWAPEATEYQDQLHGEGEYEIGFEPGPNEWRLMHGYSGQQGYRGPWMHSSEYIGGRMAEDILATPGFYVAIYPSMAEGGDPDTWAVAYIAENIPGTESKEER